MRETIEGELRIEALLAGVTAGLKPPKPKDIAEYYRRNKAQFQAPEMVRASHILKEAGEARDEAAAEREIREAAAELRKGAGFAEVADRYSDCRGNGGDLGYFPRGYMVEEFDRVVFPLAIGEISEVFRTPFGFHIAMVTGRRPAGLRPLPEVEETIREELFRQKRDRAIDHYVDRLRDRARIEDLPATAQPISNA
jgi:parvulin-like peptidyl-prolyl isomerase